MHANDDLPFVLGSCYRRPLILLRMLGDAVREFKFLLVR